ncbi:hypothetical protein A8W25_00710 [Streptomyces sp. ERV7]|uniref:hypothetical protein n=1 Tax=Streptomyces sp. ERV7 TaxID=1322334 RepID=UPI0007F3B121|nr:hypothetical protein [Streptomyces sp. ERV7]OAR26857.1 hypothetical protein A8W25_00710 [Streptomyces sp. ERV7]
MADEPDTTTLQNQYAARVTADLEANQQDQSRIRAELDTLKGQLDSLERDHGLLQTMQHTLGGPAAAAAAPTRASGRGTARVPAKAASTKDAPAKVPTPRSKKTEVKSAAKPARTPRKNTAPAKTSSRAKAETSGPTLREVVLGLFAGHQEPRTVADILTELTTAHPDRATSPQVVRNTLEALVAKGELERERKQGSVFYTARPDKKAAGTPTADAVAKA